MNDIVPSERSPKPIPSNKFIVGSDISDYRDDLVTKYRSKHQGVLQKLEQNRNMTSDDVLSSIVLDILLDSENLLGTQLLFTE